jgi:hypothetical protein
MPSTLAGLPATQARARQGELADLALFWAFVGALAWTPYWYGSNDLIAWGVNAVLFPGLAAIYELRLLVAAKPHPVGIRKIALPAALFVAVIGWILVQTATVAPVLPAHPIWDLASGALGRPLAGSISVDRDLTMLALIRLLTAGSVFWLALQLGRNAARASLLLDALVVVICVYAAYGLVAYALANGQLPWLETGAANAKVTGVTSTFVNHNSFATYAGLGLVVVCATIFRLYEREFAETEGHRRLRIATMIEATGRNGGLLLAGAFVLSVALLLTGSRGGVISTAVGLAVLAAVVMRTGAGGVPGHIKGRVTWRVGIIALAALAGIAALFGFGDPFLTDLAERGIADTGRMAVYLITLWSILDAPLTGHGYGTFADVFPMYRDRSISVQGAWEQAHNTYLEIFQGLGLLFGSMLVACVLALVVSCMHGATTRQESLTAPRVAASAAFLVSVHSLVDFSLQIQAVALTFMAILGAGVAQSESSRVALDD